MNKKQGFTLAEVLITLGVIGVVAAITLPTLIHNYQKKAWTTQLQKSYSMLEQSFQKMLADNEVSKLSETSVWASKDNHNCTYRDTELTTDSNCVDFVNNLKKYIKIIGVEKYGNKINYISGTGSFDYIDSNSLVLSDGTMILIKTSSLSTESKELCDQTKSLGGNMCSQALDLYIDVNGQRGPNTLGRDVYDFFVSDEGKLYPYGGKNHALYMKQQALDNNEGYWRNQSDIKAGCGISGTGINNVNRGFSCAARIMENGWKMDY